MVMHAEAFDWLKAVRPLLGPRLLVCELGSRDVNGSPRSLFPDSRYVGVDERPGPGVDVAADAADWFPGALFDAVVCTEALEHTPLAAEVCANAYCLLRHGGVFLATMAGPGRGAHSVDGLELPEGEFYQNVTEAELRRWLTPFPVVLIQNRADLDLYCLALK
jgi:SAM-dependent methyltransferase